MEFDAAFVAAYARISSDMTFYTYNAASCRQDMRAPAELGQNPSARLSEFSDGNSEPGS
jgi:hypothetical protein